jgi:hypothetical protein
MIERPSIGQLSTANAFEKFGLGMGKRSLRTLSAVNKMTLNEVKRPALVAGMSHMGNVG